MNLPVSVEPDKVAVYIRWSTDEQSEGTTLATQREACMHYILAQGWELREELVFVDDGYSGGSLDRPGLLALRHAIKQGQVTCVVVFKLDRLSRSVIDTVQLVMQEWEGVCHLKSTREPVDTTSATGRVFFYMLASYAEWERSLIRERTMAGKIRRAQEGRNPGMALPYGYIQGPAKGQIVVDEDQAAIVRRIYRDFLNGRGAYRIARALNDDGIPAVKGGTWHKRSVEHILRNPAYTGVLAYGKTAVASPEVRKRIGKKLVFFDQPRHAYVADAFPVIISPEDFEKAGNIRAGRSAVVGKRSLSADYLLSGIAHCRCGATLIGQSFSKGQYRYYRCCTRLAARLDECDSCGLRADIIEPMVLAELRKAVSPDNRAALMRWHEQQHRSRIVELEMALREAQQALGAIASKRERLDRDYDAGELPPRLYGARTERLDAEEARAKERIVQVTRALADLQTSRADMQGLAEEATKIDAWDHLTNEQRKQVLRHLVERLVIYRQNCGPDGRNNPHPIELDLTLRLLPGA